MCGELFDVIESSEGRSEIREAAVKAETRRELGEGEKAGEWISMLSMGSSGAGSEPVSELKELSASYSDGVMADWSSQIENGAPGLV